MVHCRTSAGRQNLGTVRRACWHSDRFSDGVWDFSGGMLDVGVLDRCNTYKESNHLTAVSTRCIADAESLPHPPETEKLPTDWHAPCTTTAPVNVGPPSEDSEHGCLLPNEPFETLPARPSGSPPGVSANSCARPSSAEHHTQRRNIRCPGRPTAKYSAPRMKRTTRRSSHAPAVSAKVGSPAIPRLPRRACRRRLFGMYCCQHGSARR